MHDRPYRSHLRPACLACRQRKSRCKVEPPAPACLMCRVHGTACSFPGGQTPGGSPGRRRRRPGSVSTSAASPGTLGTLETLETSLAATSPAGRPASATPPSSHATPHATPLSDDTDANPHVVGPANTRDSQVLADYLSVASPGTVASGGAAGPRTRMRIRPVPESRSKPVVLFASVQRRPLGIDAARASAASRPQLQVVEKLLEPHLADLAELFLAKANACLPLLDEASFRAQYFSQKTTISPALLACIYAHSMVYWADAPRLRALRPPDNRFIWNLACEALYAELHLAPGLATITALLVNVGGRPTTSMVGNGVQLGAAVSLAHSIGLNRDPRSWDIPAPEKVLRMKLWWGLRIHDKWISLTYGTPSHIVPGQHDVPPPCVDHIVAADAPPAARAAAAVFVALAGLTDVLDHCLQHLYQVTPAAPGALPGLDLRLHQWVESLPSAAPDVPDVRHVVVRGTQLAAPGAANLRLLYLAVRLLLRRLALDEGRALDEERAVDKGRGHTAGGEAAPDTSHRLLQARRTAEAVVVLVQELQPPQLRDFWLPVAAFVVASTTTFLLRCAFEGGAATTAEVDPPPAATAATSTSSPPGFPPVRDARALRLAADMVDALRRHRAAGWDLGDICLAQHAALVDRFRGAGGAEGGLEENTGAPAAPGAPGAPGAPAAAPGAPSAPSSATAPMPTPLSAGPSLSDHPPPFPLALDVPPDSPLPGFDPVDAPDLSFIDEMFPSLWDTLRGI